MRKNWVRTGSLYCYKDTADQLFKDLMRSINRRYMLISYNTGGIIPIDRMISIASSVGKVEIIGNEYIKYWGKTKHLQTK